MYSFGYFPGVRLCFADVSEYIQECIQLKKIAKPFFITE
jgi:hypothetical protein